jgi:DNA-binding GntR family transcriptional regulator
MLNSALEVERSGTERTTAARLSSLIEAEILAGSIGLGERLDESALAARFGVSRTPVREALLRLESAGLVELRDRRSAIVMKIGAEQLGQMFEVMAELEGLAARLAARRHTEADRQNIIASLDACEEAANAGDMKGYHDKNELFHQAIYAASRNTFLMEECFRLQRRLKVYRRVQLRARYSMNESLREHKAIVAAILAGDDGSAEASLKAHVGMNGERFWDLISQLQGS